jgi:hypothetical protein
MNKKNGIVAIILISFLIAIGLHFDNVISECSAKEKEEWKVWQKGVILDIDPVFADELYIMVHMSNTSWLIAKKCQMESSWPAIGEAGVMYSKTIKEDTHWKWVRKKSKKKTNTGNKKVVIKETPIKEWKKVSRENPETDKIVVVKFEDGTTSTAYMTYDKEWKLDINRNNYRGGKTITTIVEWKDIGL